MQQQEEPSFEQQEREQAFEAQTLAQQERAIEAHAVEAVEEQEPQAAEEEPQEPAFEAQALEEQEQAVEAQAEQEQQLAAEVIVQRYERHECTEHSTRRIRWQQWQAARPLGKLHAMGVQRLKLCGREGRDNGAPKSTLGHGAVHLEQSVKKLR